jgi:hypothetical protein
MTEFMDAARLRQDARDLPRFTLQPTAPVLRWTIDTTTGRPVGHWEIGDKLTPGLSLTA